MSRRSAALLVLASALFACTDAKQDGQADSLVFAAFSSPNIPTPNDLALQSVPTLTAPQLLAQRQLLQAFIDAGGFPSDQEVPVNFPLRAVAYDPGLVNADGTIGGYTPIAAPAVDLATVTPATVAVLQVGGAAPVPIAFTASSTPGLLTIRKAPDATGSRRWAPDARFVVAIRGGPNGVKAVDGREINADSATALVIPNRDLTQRENQPLGAVPDSNLSGSNADEIALLEGVRRALWLPLDWSAAGTLWAPAPSAAITPAFTAVDTVFPHAESAAVTTFGTAPLPAGPVVLIDSGSGVAPLPIDLLRTDADGTVVLNPAFGPAAAGLDTLDGFSTTAMMLAATSLPIKAGTVNGGNVFVFRIEDGVATMIPEFKASAAGGTPAAGRYIAQPPQIIDTTCGISGGCSVAIGLQPAALVPGSLIGQPAVNFPLPPLEENSLYAVVVTNRVTGLADEPLAKSTVSKIILDVTGSLYLPDNPATPAAGDPVSLLSGVSADTARTLQQMQTDLEAVWTVKPGGKTDVVTAYTFKTQSIVETALQLPAAPYGIEQAAAAPVFDVVDATDITGAPGVPTIPGVGRIVRVMFRSYDGIDKTTGAFRPTLPDELDPAGWVAKPDPTSDPNIAVLSAYVTIPSAITGACPAGYPGGTACAPLAVVGHGLNGSKTTLFAVAADLAAKGYIGVATDFPLHGDRNWCGADADCVNPSSGADGTCDKTGAFAGSAGQGDDVPPGVCSAGAVPKTAASRYFVSANFFRIREAFRQNLLDQSALVLALARQLPANPLADVLPAGTFVDPRQAHYLGISLGSIAGTSVVATNPRITRATFDVGGGTFVDIAINGPAFKDQLEPLFAELIPGFSWEAVTAGDPAFNASVAATYLRLVNVAKWVLDPGDPINFAAHVTLDPLPNLLSPTPALQASKPSYGQVSFGDTVVPNGQNLLLYSLMGAEQTMYTSDRPAGTDSSGIAFVANSVPHGIIGVLPPVTATNPVEYVTAGAQVRADATDWLIGITPPATRAFDLTP